MDFLTEISIQETGIPYTGTGIPYTGTGIPDTCTGIPYTGIRNLESGIWKASASQPNLAENSQK